MCIEVPLFEIHLWECVKIRPILDLVLLTFRIYNRAVLRFTRSWEGRVMFITYLCWLCSSQPHSLLGASRTEKIQERFRIKIKGQVPRHTMLYHRTALPTSHHTTYHSFLSYCTIPCHATPRQNNRHHTLTTPHQTTLRYAWLTYHNLNNNEIKV